MKRACARASPSAARSFWACLACLASFYTRISPQPRPTPARRCSWGLILYRTRLPAKALDKDGALDLGGAPHDYAVRV